jgi:hypothetical protein
MAPRTAPAIAVNVRFPLTVCRGIWTVPICVSGTVVENVAGNVSTGTLRKYSPGTVLYTVGKAPENVTAPVPLEPEMICVIVICVLDVILQYASIQFEPSSKANGTLVSPTFMAVGSFIPSLIACAIVRQFVNAPPNVTTVPTLRVVELSALAVTLSLLANFMQPP